MAKTSYDLAGSFNLDVNAIRSPEYDKHLEKMTDIQILPGKKEI